VKLNLADKYGISPEVAPENHVLWKQVLTNGILFHQYYEYIFNELTNVYEHKYRTNQGVIKKKLLSPIKTQFKNIKNIINKRMNKIITKQMILIIINLSIAFMIITIINKMPQMIVLF